MKKLLAVLLLAGYVLVCLPLADRLQQKPVEVKLGHTLGAPALRVLAADQDGLVGAWTMMRVLFYFGSLVEHWQRQIIVRPELYNMFKTVETVILLDPYNADPYYFAQAAFTWEAGRAADVNRLLAYGMKHRTRDWTLPFYAGFNAAYFLQDYDTAARYMRQAAELSGNSLYANLAARFFYEAGQSRFGIAFLETMIREARDPQVKNLYVMRRDALLAVQEIEEALAKFRNAHGVLPDTLEQLRAAGLLQKIPVDPYGGRFYLDDSGKVRSTSAFRMEMPAAEGSG